MSDSVGCCEFAVRDEQLGLTFPMLVMYPTATPGRPTRFGPYSIDVATDADVEGTALPLVMISHGSGGSHLLYRTLAIFLAKNGFVVGMAEHPNDNRNNNDWFGSVENLENRPRHLRLAIDAILEHPRLGTCVTAEMISIIGHSMGGYTALALAGGRPTSEPPQSSESDDDTGPPSGPEVAISTDERVAALVLLAPATVWYTQVGALSTVKAPILMLTGDRDTSTPPFHAEIVKKGVSDQCKLTHRVIENAGHYSFLSPFPEAMCTPGFPPANDPPGFNRPGFHDDLGLEVRDFLVDALARTP